MNAIVRISSIVLLVGSGLAAVAGGVYAIADPTGQMLNLPPQWIQAVLFGKYLIPGLVLLLIIGVSSLVIALLAIVRHPHSTRLIILQGWIVAVWVGVQVVVVHSVHPLHIIFGAIGFLIFGLGMIMSDEEQATHHLL